MCQLHTHKLRAKALYAMLRVRQTNLYAIAFDMVQIHSMLRLTIQESYYSRKLTIYNFGICSLKKGKHYSYTWKEYHPNESTYSYTWKEHHPNESTYSYTWKEHQPNESTYSYTWKEYHPNESTYSYTWKEHQPNESTYSYTWKEYQPNESTYSYTWKEYQPNESTTVTHGRSISQMKALQLHMEGASAK